MVFSPTVLYQGYAQLNSKGNSKSSKRDEPTGGVSPKVSHNETVRATLRTMSEEEHVSVLASLKGRHRRRMTREISKIVHERHLKALRSGLL